LSMVLPACILAPACFRIDTADEIHDVSHVILAETVIYPGGHGRTLHAIKNGFEEPVIAGCLHEPGIAEIARARHDIERVRPLAVGFTPVASGAALDEGSFAASRRFGAHGNRIGLRHLVRLDFAWRLTRKVGIDEVQESAGTCVVEHGMPGWHRGTRHT